MLLKRAHVAFFAIGSLPVFLPATALAISMGALFQGESITALDKRFSNFSLVDVQAVNGGFANLGQVEVTPLIDDPLNPGLKFTVPFDAIGTPFGHDGLSSVTAIFEFDVQTTSGLALIKDNSLLINDYTFDAGPNAFIQITEQVLDASGGSLGDKLAIVHGGDLPDDPDHFDSLDFDPQSFLHVRKTINVVGPNTNDGARLEMFEQRFSQVPEPGTLIIACVVGLWLSVCRPARCR
jgi:hypothetical protein